MGTAVTTPPPLREDGEVRSGPGRPHGGGRGGTATATAIATDGRGPVVPRPAGPVTGAAGPPVARLTGDDSDLVLGILDRLRAAHALAPADPADPAGESVAR
ncbi:hypothetical protein [Cellulomonas endophytica]|uniref:hypothetical protein n=1 Tax=Cellulomonas endophytica TaxID=2494735 RepID=UPI001011A661|nr:hypothetical protein [Cellulomonas endophytica]